MAKAGKPKRRRAAEPSPESTEIAQYLYDAIRSHTPEFGTKPKVTAATLTGWAKKIDVGLRNDGFEVTDYKRAIDFAHRDPSAWVGWKANIRGGNSLRNKCGKLLAQADTPTGGRGDGPVHIVDEMAGIEKW